MPTLGLLPAVCDGAEVVLKPVFGSPADRIGPRPVLLVGALGVTGALSGGLLGLAGVLAVIAVAVGITARRAAG